MSSTLHVIILSNRFPPFDIGGAERIAYYHAHGLKERGYRVSVVTTQGPEIQNYGKSIENGIAVYRVLPQSPFSRKDPEIFLDKIAGATLALRNPFIKKVLREIVKELTPDLIHAHFASRFGFGTIAEAAGKIPSVITFHGYQYECPRGSLYRKSGKICEEKPILCKLYRSAMKKELSGFDRIIAISTFIENRLHEAGFPKEGVQYIPNGVPDLGFGKTSILPSKQVLFVGRVERNKGVGELLEAFSSVQDSEASLKIVGDGEAQEELEQMVARDSRIRFLGRKNHQEVLSLYDKSQVVVVPSLWHEVMNTVICEAQSRARPVIATRVGGNGDLVIDQKSGFLCSPGDVQGLTEKISLLLSDFSLASQMGEAGFDHVSKFTMDEHLKRIEELYAEIV